MAGLTLKEAFKYFKDKFIGDHSRIKNIGDGTCTGAISTINDSLSNTSSVILTPTGNTNITDQFSMRIGNMIVLDFWFKCTDYIPYNYAVADIPMNAIQRFDLFGIDDKSTPYFFYTEGTAIRALTPILANSNVMIKGIIFV